MVLAAHDVQLLLPMLKIRKFPTKVRGHLRLRLQLYSLAAQKKTPNTPPLCRGRLGYIFVQPSKDLQATSIDRSL